MNKKALIVVSFGTTYKPALKTIEQIENGLKETFNNYNFFRAFTSKVIIDKLARENLIINTLDEILENLYKANYNEVLCQPLYVAGNIDLSIFYNKFKIVKLGKPILYSDNDYKICCEVIANNILKEENEAIILMGHGSKYSSNDLYIKLENNFKALNFKNIYVSTLENSNLSYIIECISKENIKKVYLAPFTLLAGVHTQKDLNNTWKSILINKGYEVEVILKGLGEYEEIIELINSHSKEAKFV